MSQKWWYRSGYSDTVYLSRILPRAFHIGSLTIDNETSSIVFLVLQGSYLKEGNLHVFASFFVRNIV